MRLIKAFLFGAIGLFTIITLFSLVIPSRVRVSRGILINNTNPAVVYRQTANIENWKKWHPVFTMDSASLVLRSSATKGAHPEYHIIQHGKEAIITPLSADSISIHFLLHAPGKNDIDNDIVITSLSSQSVQVEWRAITKLHWYPWEKMYGIFIDRMTGPGYESALNGLKDYIEKNAGSQLADTK